MLEHIGRHSRNPLIVTIREVAISHWSSMVLAKKINFSVKVFQEWRNRMDVLHVFSNIVSLWPGI